MKTKLVTSIIIALVSISSFGQSSRATVTELLEKSGSTAQLKELDVLINSKLKDSRAAFENDTDYKKFIAIMKSGFNSKSAVNYYIEYFERYSNEDSLKKISAIYNSPLMKEITKIELEANAPSKLEEQAAYFQGLEANPPTKERMEQVVALNKALGASEMMLKLIKNMMFSMGKGMNNSQPKEKQIPLNDLIQKMEAAIPTTFSQQLEKQIISVFLFTYKDLSDEKLNEYIKVWETPLGKYFTEKTFGAFDYSFSRMGETLGGSLSK